MKLSLLLQVILAARVTFFRDSDCKPASVRDIVANTDVCRSNSDTGNSHRFNCSTVTLEFFSGNLDCDRANSAYSTEVITGNTCEKFDIFTSWSYVDCANLFGDNTFLGQTTSTTTKTTSAIATTTATTAATASALKSSESSSLGVGAIVGIIVAVVVVLLFLVA